jgi:hypothetical protein
MMHAMDILTHVAAPRNTKRISQVDKKMSPHIGQR